MSNSVFTVYILDERENRLYLKYLGPVPETTFSNSGGLKWKTRSKAEDFCKTFIHHKCFVQEMDKKDFEDMITLENTNRWTLSKGFVKGRVQRGKRIPKEEVVVEEVVDENPFIEEKTFSEKVSEAVNNDPDLFDDELTSFHPICVKCSRRCKQNPNAVIMNCPIFNKVE